MVLSPLKIVGHCLKAVRGDDDGAAFISLADDLEKQVGSTLIDGQVAQFV